MANGRNKSVKGDSGRDAGGFVALPWTVLDCPAYGRPSHPARSLLMEFARQFVKDNNGRLLASGAYLRKRGWKSTDVITRAKFELLAAGFIFETVAGHRPNKASWYAVTWRRLDKLKGYDVGTIEMFKRGAYAAGVPLQPQPARQELYAKWQQPAVENASLTPAGGVESAQIAPSGGVGGVTVAPSGGAIDLIFVPLPTPPHGNHLDIPSLAANTVRIAQEEQDEVICVRDSHQDLSHFHGSECFQRPLQPVTVRKQAFDH